MQFLTARIRYQLNDFSFIVLQKTLGLIFFVFLQSQYILVVTQFGNKKKGGGNKSFKIHRKCGPASSRHALEGRRSGRETGCC